MSTNESELRRQIEEARQTYPDVAALANVTDEDLVLLGRRSSGAAESFLAEVARRQLRASAELKTALTGTSRRLYALTVVLTLYTIAIVLATLFLALKR